VATAKERHTSDLSRHALIVRKAVRGHERERIRPQQSHSVYGAPTDKEARESEIVVRCGPQSLTTGDELHVVRPLGNRRVARTPRTRGEMASLVESKQADSPVPLLDRHDEAGVVHTKGIEDPTLEDL
jgi:hypothetical protein